jgi:hypothetical protein
VTADADARIPEKMWTTCEVRENTKRDLRIIFISNQPEVVRMRLMDIFHVKVGKPSHDDALQHKKPFVMHFFKDVPADAWATLLSHINAKLPTNCPVPLLK